MPEESLEICKYFSCIMTGVLESILQEKSVQKTGKNLKEVSVVPMDIDIPMLLRSKSSMSNKSLTSNSSDDTHQETTE